MPQQYTWEQDPDKFNNHFDDITHLTEDQHAQFFANERSLTCEGLKAPFQVVETWESAYDSTFVLPPLAGSTDYPYVLVFSNDPRKCDEAFKSWLGNVKHSFRKVTKKHVDTGKEADFFFVGLTNWGDAEEISELFCWGDYGTFSLNGHIFYSGQKYYDHFGFA